MSGAEGAKRVVSRVASAVLTSVGLATSTCVGEQSAKKWRDPSRSLEDSLPSEEQVDMIWHCPVCAGRVEEVDILDGYESHCTREGREDAST